MLRHPSPDGAGPMGSGDSMRRIAGVGLAFVVVACSFLFPLTAAQGQGRQALPPGVAAPEGASLIGRLPGSQTLQLALALPLRNEEQLSTLLQQLYDPASPNYRQFLTVQQFTEQFGPTVADYQRVTAFAQSHRLRVTHTFENRLVVDVSGTVSSVEQAFHIKMQVYQHPTESRTFYAPDSEPTIEPGLPVLSIVGLSTFSLPHSMLKRALPNEGVHSDQTGSGPSGQFLGSDMRTAYGGGTSLDGAGQVVGLIELGPYRLNDVLSYFSTLSQPLNVPITNVLVGVNGVCGVGCDDGEEVIDIQQAISMAPNLSALLVYETNGPNTDALSAYAQAASDNIAKQLSLSFGWGDVPGSTTGKAYEQVFEELEAQGISSFVASGDAGASLSGGYPGNSPNITDAGGTDLTTSAGQVWSSEMGWIGSGGGWNVQSPIPATPTYSWNQGPAINASNGGDPNYRNIPDVSAEANTDNYFCANGSCQGGIGGTSLASPRWAAFVALINQQATANATATGNPTLGFLNPTIYTLSSGNYASDFHDLTTGNNATSTACTVGSLGCLPSGVVGFDAVTGFDLVTGWGSPNGPTVFDALFPATTSANFSMAATPSVVPLAAAGNGGSSSISVTALHGFSAATNLTVVIPGTGSPSYAPAGLSAQLSASSIPAGGTPVSLQISTTSATPGGTYVIAIVGTSGGLTQTAYVTVELPAFVGLSATPAAGVSLNAGGTATATVTSTLINGFSGTVNLAASGLPSGVTASFTAVNSTTTTVTFSASSTAALTGAGNPAAITITGTATGSTSQQTGINLFVNPPASGGSGTPVTLSPANVYAFYTDAEESTITAPNSLDGVGYAFSANLLNTGLDFKGTQFTFGTPNQANAVYGTGTPIALPAGSYATLQLLATGIEGNQASQTVTVTYTDSTTSQFTQSFSDWCSALNSGCVSTGSNSGESVAVAMPYRDSAAGPDNRVFYLYHYSFAINSAKTVQSVTLPSNRDVVVLAATLTAPPPAYSLSAPQVTTPASVNPGSPASAIVTVTPANGYTGSVTLSCAISPVVTGSDAPTCAFTSNPVSITNGAATATLTFTTVAPPTGAASRRLAKVVAPIRPAPDTVRRWNLLYASWIVVPGLALIGMGFGSQGSRRKRLLGCSLFWIMSATLLLLPACGGGSNNGGGGGGCSSVPSVPTGLAASSTTSSATTLNWTASTAGSGCTVTSYTVYQNNTSIATTTSPTYNVTGLSASTQYSFMVAASDSDGASAQSTAIQVTTLSNGTPANTYTITITGKDANGVAQTGNPPTVTAIVN
jgi:subtilase family serine protease